MFYLGGTNLDAFSLKQNFCERNFVTHSALKAARGKDFAQVADYLRKLKI
jgi:hypothetical protein